MDGHVFVVHGNQSTLACDAWLVPVDEDGHVATTWLPDLDLTACGLEPTAATGGSSRRSTTHGAAARRSAAWRPVRELLESLGARPSTSAGPNS